MATYLLVWNPKRWHFDELPECVDVVKKYQSIELRWSCGLNKRIQRGERVFLIRLGKEPKGIFASGTVVKGSYEDKHWLPEKAKAGDKALFVTVEFEVLLDPLQDKILRFEHLSKAPFSQVKWSTQSGGISIPEDIASKLEDTWAELNGVEMVKLPEEVSNNEKFYEGARRWISINAYERNPRARKICIDKYGVTCWVCKRNLAELYGEVAEGLIHVHHLKPFYEVKKEYEIDPVRDLRPVCPNCHAVIHLKKSPYTIEQVKEFLKNVANSNLLQQTA